MTIGFNCPKCGSANTKSRRTASSSTVDNASDGIINIMSYCCKCKLAWSRGIEQPDRTRIMRSRNKSEIRGVLSPSRDVSDDDTTDSDEFVDAAGRAPSAAPRGHIEECANCNVIISHQDPVFLCSNGCGRSFHMQCVHDPLNGSLVCQRCTNKPESGEMTTAAARTAFLNECREVIRSVMANEKDHDVQLPGFSGAWPQSCQFRVESLPPASSTCNDGQSASSSSALLASIRTAWKTLQMDLPDDLRSSPSADLDSITETNLNSAGFHFLDGLLRKVLQIRSFTMESKAQESAGSWQAVFHASRALGIDEEVIKAAEGALQGLMAVGEFRDALKPDKPNKRPLRQKDTETWTVERVIQFLHDNDLSELDSMFTSNGVDGVTLLDLTYEDLKDDLELADEGLIRRLLDAVDRIKDQ
ncbi:SAM domain-containing protein [Plasmodiophora brassicae]